MSIQLSNIREYIRYSNISIRIHNRFIILENSYSFFFFETNNTKIEIIQNFKIVIKLWAIIYKIDAP